MQGMLCTRMVALRHIAAGVSIVLAVIDYAGQCLLALCDRDDRDLAHITSLIEEDTHVIITYHHPTQFYLAYRHKNKTPSQDRSQF